MRNNRLKSRDRTRGGALVEFAVVFPLLLLICMGAADFSRLFFHAVTVANAAGTGAFYGAQDNIAAGDFQAMEQRASDDSQNLNAVSATASQFCGCPDGTQVACTDILVTTCSGYGTPRAYVRTNVRQNFQTLGPYPGIPSSTQIGRTAWMRVR